MSTATPQSPPFHVLVVGGQRSGKSRFAEKLVAESGEHPFYIATATAGDGEMIERITVHRQRRGAAWTTIEEPFELALAIERAAEGASAILVDCLSLWLSNLIEAGWTVEPETEALVTALGRSPVPVVIVSNEVGSGIIPNNALARRYADALGTLNQRIGASVGRVVFMAAGLPLVVKPSQLPEITL